MLSGYAYAASIDFELVNHNVNHWIKKGYKITFVNPDLDRKINYTLQKDGSIVIGDDGLIETIGKADVILCIADILKKNTNCYRP